MSVDLWCDTDPVVICEGVSDEDREGFMDYIRENPNVLGLGVSNGVVVSFERKGLAAGMTLPYRGRSRAANNEYARQLLRRAFAKYKQDRRKESSNDS